MEAEEKVHVISSTMKHNHFVTLQITPMYGKYLDGEIVLLHKYSELTQMFSLQ